MLNLFGETIRVTESSQNAFDVVVRVTSSRQLVSVYIASIFSQSS